jgi:hypothetical protein
MAHHGGDLPARTAQRNQVDGLAKVEHEIVVRRKHSLGRVRGEREISRETERDRRGSHSVLTITTPVETDGLFASAEEGLRVESQPDVN